MGLQGPCAGGPAQCHAAVSALQNAQHGIGKGLIIQRIAVEQRACARQIEDNRRNCDVEARQKMADAEQRAQRQADEILLRSRGECEKMQQAAREKLDRAAQWIAEEVVRNEWQS